MKIRHGKFYVATLSVTVVAATGILWIEKTAAEHAALTHSPDDVIVRDYRAPENLSVYEAPFFQGGPIYLSQEPAQST